MVLELKRRESISEKYLKLDFDQTDSSFSRTSD